MEGYSKGMQANIWKIYILFITRGSIFHIAILVLFFMENGMSLRDVFILHAIFGITKAILEIPSGYLSDRWGRKSTIFIGGILKFFGVLCYCLGSSFPPFLLGIILLSAGSSMYSGTIEAMTYDTLLALKKESTYRYLAGKQAFAQFISEAAVSVIGGFLATISLRTPIWATLAAFGVAPIITLMLHEPARKKLQGTQHLQVMWRIFTHSLIHNVPLRSVLILHTLIVTMAYSLFWFTQPYQEMVGLPLALFGITHALIVAAHAFGSRYAHVLGRWIDDRLLLSILAGILCSSFFALGWVVSLWGLILFLLVRSVWGIITPITTDMLNRMTSSDIRATVLSIRSLGFHLLFAIASPMLGYVADVFSLNQAILLAAVIGSIAIITVLLMMRSVWDDIPQ